MADLRKLYGEDYYKNIRKKRKAPSTGSFQYMDKERLKEVAKSGAQKRWSDRGNPEQTTKI